MWIIEKFDVQASTSAYYIQYIYRLSCARENKYHFFEIIPNTHIDIDVGKLAAHVEDEVARKKNSLGIVQIWHLVSDWLELYLFGKPQTSQA
jgi:hypothetical protein